MPTFPQAPTPNPWVDGEDVDAVKMYDRVTSLLNAVQRVLPQVGYQVVTIPAGSNSVVAHITFPTPYTVSPTIILVSLMDGNGITRVVWARVPTITGFDVVMSFPDGSTKLVDYGGRVAWAAFP